MNQFWSFRLFATAEVSSRRQPEMEMGTTIGILKDSIPVSHCCTAKYPIIQSEVSRQYTRTSHSTSGWADRTK